MPKTVDPGYRDLERWLSGTNQAGSCPVRIKRAAVRYGSSGRLFQRWNDADV